MSISHSRPPSISRYNGRVSRAFMKEPEPGEPRCPKCAGLGEPVGLPTLEAHLAADVRAPLGATAFYCPDPACAVAYFNGWGTSVPREKLTSTAYPKDPEAPVCS